jgi:2-oxoglutarate ferredoxin oxidoreductase subunit gamma
MIGQKNVMLCGFGGQGIVLAGEILGKAGVIAGYNAAQATSYGAESRGSACRCEIIISTSAIIYPHIRKADILGVMSQAGYDKFKLKLTDHSGLLFYDSSLVKVEASSHHKLFGLPATEIASRELARKIVANLVFLAVIVKQTGIVPLSTLEKAVREVVPEKYLALNLKAVEVGLSHQISFHPNKNSP